MSRGLEAKKPMQVEHFVRHFKRMLQQQEGNFAFFLGAGCSISSGIPGARKLVEDWLPQLYEEMASDGESYEAWVEKELPAHESENPAASYAAVMRRLFRQPPQRQPPVGQSQRIVA